MTKDELIRQIRLAQSRGKRARYAPAVRSAVVQHATERRAAKVSWNEISQELGVGAGVMHQWMSARPSRLLPVKLVSATSPVEAAHAGAVVHGPRGVRIEGLSVSELAELITRLGA